MVVRYQITDVCRLEEVIAQTKYRYGWRVQVTNLPGKLQLLAACVMIYNGGWSLEREFHLLKDVPLGIRPLYVREDEQLIGLTRLLTIALRLLTLFEIRVRAALEAEGEELAGLYDGQPNRKTSRPTATRLLRALARMEITWTQVECAETFQWQLSVLPPLLIRILELVDLSPTVYTQLADNSG